MSSPPAHVVAEAGNEATSVVLVAAIVAAVAQLLAQVAVPVH